MEPNLDSPPGPWWTADLSGEGSMVGWYAEFADQRRGEEVPAVTQIYHMQRSLEELQEDFAAQALELKPGNNSWSTSQFNNTAGLAARIGFGLFHGDKATYYLDRQLALDMANVIPDFNTGYDMQSGTMAGSSGCTCSPRVSRQGYCSGSWFHGAALRCAAQQLPDPGNQPVH